MTKHKRIQYAIVSERGTTLEVREASAEHPSLAISEHLFDKTGHEHAIYVEPDGWYRGVYRGRRTVRLRPVPLPRAEVVLTVSSDELGPNATPADYDAAIRYLCERISEGAEMPVQVVRLPWGAKGPEERVQGHTCGEDRETVLLVAADILDEWRATRSTPA